MITQSLLRKAVISVIFSIYGIYHTVITIECTEPTCITKCISFIFRFPIESIIVSKVQNIKIMILSKSAVKHPVNKTTYVDKLLKNAPSFSKSMFFSSKINFNHGFTGLPLTFSVLNGIYPVTQFPTSGPLKVNKDTCFWSMKQPVLKQCFLNEKLNVIPKFFDSLLKKELNFQNITFRELFYSEKYRFFEFNKTIAFLSAVARHYNRYLEHFIGHTCTLHTNT